MTSSTYGLYKLGYTRATMITTKSYTKNFWVNLLNVIVFGSQTATRLREGGITSNRKPAYYGEFCT